VQRKKIKNQWPGASIFLRAFILCLVGLIMISGCGKRAYVKHPSKRLVVLPEKGRDPTMRPYLVNGERYYPLPDAEGFVQYGKASWYGKKFHGRPTSNGEIYNMYKISAAHKTLPMGTYVRVTNTSNQKEIIVRVNDRGPFVKGRIIDLSYAAAKKIGILGPGTAKVKIVALGKEVGNFKSPLGIKPVVEIEDLQRGAFTVQVGAFKNKYNALKLVDRLKVVFSYVDVAVYGSGDSETIYRVRVSKSETLRKASEVEKKLEEMGFEGAFVVSL
jgi:rare lipoprotein A